MTDIVPACARFRLSLLDGFELQFEGGRVDLQPGAERLLAFLALVGRYLERSSVAYRLWPDKSEDRALANLRTTLWRMRRLDPDLIEVSTSCIRINPAVWVDARHGLDQTHVCDADEAYAAVKAIAKGDLLPNWCDEWLPPERERLRQVRLHAFDEVGRDLVEQGRLFEAIDVGLHAVAMDPLRESSHRLVIKAHLHQGNWSEAHRQYESYARLLGAELGAKPSRQMMALFCPRDAVPPPPVVAGS